MKLSNPIQTNNEELRRGAIRARKGYHVLVPQSSWGSSKLFGATDTDTEGCEYGRLAVEVLRLLYHAFPNQIAVGETDRSIVDTLQFKQIWSWLFDQQIVVGSPASGALTPSGMRAFHVAVRQYPDLRGLHMTSDGAASAGRSSRVILAMLRAHVIHKPPRSILT